MFCFNILTSIHCIADKLFKNQPNQTCICKRYFITHRLCACYNIILLIMYLFSLFYLGADTPVYLAMLPAGTTSPKGKFVSDRTIQNWGWLSNRLWKRLLLSSFNKEIALYCIFCPHTSKSDVQIVPPWGGWGGGHLMEIKEEHSLKFSCNEPALKCFNICCAVSL